ncbi:hypothetical protein ESZ36_11435 [Colwellia demingiae]|uniref:Uncharacterized protein n=1 Tax=Colwellia demingiae TaxID=89401 RepID=A0A5C6QG00_9GAMM|nr:hypothetical protein [Colwellia demingiae]TWX67895.1 hypothetical protein ESZ36_11435 [Colwellia demingiae]
MKIFIAIMVACLAVFLFHHAYGIEGVSLERLGYIAGGVISVVVVLALFIPKQEEGQERKF